MRPVDDVSRLPDSELRTMLLTADGRGAANKAAALDELLRRTAGDNKPRQEVLVAGSVWHSKQHAFMVACVGPTVAPSFDHSLSRSSFGAFTGYPATRVFDGASALVALTEKPDGYPYDFVLIGVKQSNVKEVL